MTAIRFARDQWYVAAYRHEVGASLLARTVLGEPLVLYRTEAGEPVALADRCVHRRVPAVAEPARRRPDRLRVPRLHLRRPAAPASPSRRRPAIPRTARRADLPGGRAGLAGLGVDRRPGPGRPGPDPPGALARRARLDHRQRDGAARRPLQPAGRQPARPVARDLPARRLHRHAGGGRDADHHRGRRGRRHRAGQPAHERRRVPAVLRPVDRHRGPDRPAGRTSSTTRRACTCCTAASHRPASSRRPDGTDRDAFHAEIVYAITPSTETSTYGLLGGVP